MNDKYFESLHVLSLLTDLKMLTEAFRMFPNVKSYGEFHALVGNLLDFSSVLYINPEYDESEDGDIKWLTLSTDYFCHSFAEIGMKIVFCYTCSFSTNNIYLRDCEKYVITIGRKICTLDEAIEIVTEIAYPSEKKDLVCC
jgi:hypothetical protein